VTCRYEGGKTYVHSYNAENRLAAVLLFSGNCTDHGITPLAGWGFSYDGDGSRVKQVYTDGSGSLTTFYFMGGAYEVRSDGKTIKYYAFAGQTVAMRSCTGGTCSAPSYFLTDHLGSIAAVTDANGARISQQRYLPYGQVRTDVVNKVTQTDFGYTGQRNLDAQNNQYSLGLMDYRARFYSVSLGRFTQPDTIVPSAGNPQEFDRYAYVNNSPINYNDPTGHVCSDPDDPTPSCEGGGAYPINQAPLPSAPVLMNTDLLYLPLSPSSMNNGGYDYGADNGTIAGHNGVDLDVPPDEIQASSYGIVHSSDACSLTPCDNLPGQNGALVNGGYGNVLIIEYPYYSLPLETRRQLVPGQSLFILYAHLKETSPLQIKDLVTPEQFIGNGGSSGNSTGTHLHLETRVGYSAQLGFLPMATTVLYSPDTLWGQWWALPVINPHSVFDFDGN
jgi:RHS repeat-associated protein